MSVRNPCEELRQGNRERLSLVFRPGRVAAVAGPTALAYGAGRLLVEFADVERKMTRVGITAEASREEMRAFMIEAQRLAQSTAMSFGDVAGGYEALAAQGRKIGHIREFMPSVARTAQASGASAADIANAAGSAALGGGSRGMSIGTVHVRGVRDLAQLERDLGRRMDSAARDAQDDALHDTGDVA